MYTEKSRCGPSLRVKQEGETTIETTKNRTWCTYMGKVRAADQHMLGRQLAQEALEKGPLEHATRRVIS